MRCWLLRGGGKVMGMGCWRCGGVGWGLVGMEWLLGG